jgi:hypothetical protein
MNKLRIRGQASRLQEFRTLARGQRPPYAEPKDSPFKEEMSPLEELEFHNIVPIPAEILALTYDEGGLDWEKQNWSVKWGACNSRVVDSDDENELVYSFDTPWRDPDEWVRNASIRFPDLEFTLYYDEPGMRFRGRTAYVNGHRKNKIVEEYDEEPDDNGDPSPSGNDS